MHVAWEMIRPRKRQAGHAVHAAVLRLIGLGDAGPDKRGGTRRMKEPPARSGAHVLEWRGEPSDSLAAGYPGRHIKIAYGA